MTITDRRWFRLIFQQDKRRYGFEQAYYDLVAAVAFEGYYYDA